MLPTFLIDACQSLSPARQASSRSALDFDLPVSRSIEKLDQITAGAAEPTQKAPILLFFPLQASLLPPLQLLLQPAPKSSLATNP